MAGQTSTVLWKPFFFQWICICDDLPLVYLLEPIRSNVFWGMNGEGDQIIEDLRLFNIIKIILVYKLRLF